MKKFRMLLTVVFGLALVALVFFALFLEIKTSLFHTYVVDIVVEDKSTASYCAKNVRTGGRYSRHESRRSERVVKYSFEDFCGEIYTNMGNFLLPQSDTMKFWWQSREQLHKTIKVGCKYTVKIWGRGPPPALNRRPQNRPRQNIIAVYSSKGCGGEMVNW